MIFIWRGFGIVVPIIFFLSCWITSYWFPDTKLSNAPFIGWSMLWAGIVLILFALASFGGDLDENGESTGKKSYNDFFWIPIWVWCLGFIAGSIYLIYQDDSTDSSHSYALNDTDEDDYESSSYASDSDYSDDESSDERNLYLYNCSSDSMAIEITETNGDGTNFNFYVQSYDYEYVSIVPNDYTVKMGDYTDKIKLKEANKRDDKDYGHAWMVLCADVDLVVVDVTEICKRNVTAEEVTDINWERYVVERFHGDAIAEPVLRSKDGGEVKLVAPNIYLPTERKNHQSIYVLIPITRSKTADDEFLEDEIKRIIK